MGSLLSRLVGVQELGSTRELGSSIVVCSEDQDICEDVHLVWWYLGRSFPSVSDDVSTRVDWGRLEWLVAKLVNWERSAGAVALLLGICWCPI